MTDDPAARPRPVVREAGEHDVSAFADFLRAAWSEAGPGAPGFAGASDEAIAELTQPDAIRQRIIGPGRSMYVAWDGGVIVGFAATKNVDERTVELVGVIVSRSHTGRGIGTGLVAAAVAPAERGTYRSMIVRTETTNDAARAFYESCGFRATHATTEHVGDTAVAVWELVRDL